MRVDYLVRSWSVFTARAETLRLGRKGCTMRMTMLNDEAKPIVNCNRFLCLLSIVFDMKASLTLLFK